MILGEKITELRRQNGWSQEELAGKLNVSRQSVSKWESSMSVPELDKILQLSDLFEVSTDYLLKDDQKEDHVPGYMTHNSIRKVTMEEAQEFIRVRREVSGRIGAGVMTCILSPVPLLLLNRLAEARALPLSEDLAGGIGLGVLLLMVSAAVGCFILFGMKLGKYEWLEQEEFELCYGISGMVSERKEAENLTFTKKLAAGVALCIIGPIPLLLAGAADAGDTMQVMGVIILLIMVAAAVYLFVDVGMKKGAYDQLLQIGDYTKEEKKASKIIERIAVVYWCLCTSIYVGVSLLTDNWDSTWILWPVAGILFGAIAGSVKMFHK